jgi:hypothetical protein
MLTILLTRMGKENGLFAGFYDQPRQWTPLSIIAENLCTYNQSHKKRKKKCSGRVVKFGMSYPERAKDLWKLVLSVFTTKGTLKRFRLALS